MADKKKKSSRRANNEGSIYKRQDGSWCAQVTIGYDEETGKIKRKTLYGKTQAEAKKKRDEVLLQLQVTEPGRSVPNPTVELFTRSFLLNAKKGVVNSRSLDWYTNLAESHIYPALGNIPLSALTMEEVQRFLNGMLSQDNLSLRTIEAVRNLLNQTMQYACQIKMLKENPVRYTRLPKSDRRVGSEEKEALSPDLRKRILEAAAGDEVMRPILITLMFTGMRTGEMLALPWKNVDLENRVITVDRAVTQDTEFDSGGKPVSRKTVVAMPKTKNGIRQIAMPAQVVEALQAWRNKIAAEHPEWLQPEAPVFANQKGELRTYGGFRTNYRHFLKRHGLDGEHLNLHRFRHTYGSMLMEQDVNPRVVQKLMGHKDIKTTLGTYSHVSKELFEDAAARLGDAYEQVSVPESAAENEEKPAD